MLWFGRRASTLGDEVSAACETGCDWMAWKDKDARGHRDAAIGYTLDVLGLAALAGGAIMYYLGDRARSVTISPRSDGGATLTCSGAW